VPLAAYDSQLVFKIRQTWKAKIIGLIYYCNVQLIQLTGHHSISLSLSLDEEAAHMNVNIFFIFFFLL